LFYYAFAVKVFFFYPAVARVYLEGGSREFHLKLNFTRLSKTGRDFEVVPVYSLQYIESLTVRVASILYHSSGKRYNPLLSDNPDGISHKWYTIYTMPLILIHS